MSHFFADDGEKIHLHVSGDGTPPIVMLHGWTSSHQEWFPFLQDLNAHHRVWRWDARGHGQSPGARGDNSYRLYSSADVHQLRFIRLCRAMDMSLDEVRTLLALDWDSKTDCHAACDMLDAHLVHVRTRLAELQALEADLQALRSRCDGADATCHIIEALHARADAQPVGAAATPSQGKRHV